MLCIGSAAAIHVPVIKTESLQHVVNKRQPPGLTVNFMYVSGSTSSTTQKIFESAVQDVFVLQQKLA